MKSGLLMAAAALLGIAAITPAQATTYTFGWLTLSNANTVLGLDYSESSNGITLTAYGLTAPANLTQPATAGPDLYAKNGGSGDTGLGLTTSTGGNPGMINDGVQVDFANALAAAPNATVTMRISGLQSGASWAIYGSNTLLTVVGDSKTDGALGQPLLSGSGRNSDPTATVNLPDWGEYAYYTLMSTGSTMCDSADILLGTVTIDGGVTTQSTPEPGSMLLGGTALIAIGVGLKKRQKKV
jgi:hypothetical protein